jgi:hypothetical protein
MKTARWSEVRERLRAYPTGREPPGRDAFWSDFKARARMTPQAAPEPEPAAWRRLAPRYGIGLAAVAAALMAVFMLPQASPLGNRIRSLEVVASHTGVMILNDSASKGTILWVTGLEPGSGGGG